VTRDYQRFASRLMSRGPVKIRSVGPLSWDFSGAALGSRTPDLRITSSHLVAYMVLTQSIRARQCAHCAQIRTP
jgi:hypothetical protein